MRTLTISEPKLARSSRGWPGIAPLLTVLVRCAADGEIRAARSRRDECRVNGGSAHAVGLDAADLGAAPITDRVAEYAVMFEEGSSRTIESVLAPAKKLWASKLGFPPGAKNGWPLMPDCPVPCG